MCMIEEEELQFLLYWKNYLLWKMSRSKILFGGSSLKMELAVCVTFRGFNNIFHKQLPMMESAAVSTKGAVPRGVWGHVPPEKFEI